MRTSAIREHDDDLRGGRPPLGAGRKLRVLHVTQTLGIGGAERVVASLAVQQRRSGHAAAVVSLFGPRKTWIEEELEASAVPVRFLGKRPGLDLRMIPCLARVLRELSPDVVHTHGGVLKYAAPAVALTSRCRIVHTIHTLAQYEVERPSRAFQYLAFRLGVIPVAIGERVAESVREVYGLAARRVIPNGIRVSDLVVDPAARLEVRRSLGIPEDAPTFVTVGRLVPDKNMQDLLRALASARLREAGARLVVAGGGPLREELTQQARAIDVSDRVLLLGPRNDVPRLLAGADVFVLASRREGNPLSVMEAMAAAKPVVATAVGCIPELVSADTGRLVAPGDVAALEGAMYELASDPRLAIAKGHAAARVARERFDEASMARAYEELYTT